MTIWAVEVRAVAPKANIGAYLDDRTFWTWGEDGDEVIEVQKDDVVYIPASVPHWYCAEGDEPFEFLCMVPNLPDETTIVDPDSG